MKKTFLTSFVFITVMSASAQLRVTENGNVGINTFNPGSILTVNCNGDSQTTAAFRSNLQNCVSIDGTQTSLNVSSVSSGIFVGQRFEFPTANKGIYICPVTGISSKDSYGILCYSGVSQADNYGLTGCYFNMTSSVGKNGAGVYGSSSIQTGFEYPGVYAGYFKGNARVTGNLYAKVLTPALSSNALSSNVIVSQSVTNEQENVLELLSQVDVIKQDEKPSKVQSSSKSSNQFIYNPEDTLKQSDFEKMIDLCNTTESKVSTTSYSLAADQLEKIFPELVDVDEDGNYSIDYSSMIPLLLQSIKDLKSKIENGTIISHPVSRRSLSSSVTNIEEYSTVATLLEQNNPNPFKENTVVRFNIPEKIRLAYLYIYDMTGKQIEKIRINERGMGSVSIHGGNLSAGMYLYSLIVDDEEVATKRMILTK